MRSSLYVGLVMAAIAGSAGAKLPPLDEDGKLKAAETAAKNAWNEKVGLFKHCQALDRIAASYRSKTPTAASAVPVATPACTDPGPYVSAAAAAASAAAGTTAVAAAAGGAAVAQGAAAAKPLEASGVHSPAATATTPPATRTPAAAAAPIAATANAGAAAKPAPGAQPARTAATPITSVKDKPIEMSEAHSPPGTAVSPPSVNATNAELTGKAKK